jgi:uncharacterized protein YgfB (UPF0149 family)
VRSRTINDIIADIQALAEDLYVLRDEILDNLDELAEMANLGVDSDTDFDDNEPNLCDKCQRTMNRKGNRQ